MWPFDIRRKRREREAIKARELSAYERLMRRGMVGNGLQQRQHRAAQRTFDSYSPMDAFSPGIVIDDSPRQQSVYEGHGGSFGGGGASASWDSGSSDSGSSSSDSCSSSSSDSGSCSSD